MAITRTAQVDDDGSGTTGTIWNNAWKTELYNQIDANPAVQTYTPTWGATGTAPVMGPSNTLNGWYTRTGSLVHFWIQFIIQPGTSFGTGAWTFSLPNLYIAGSPLAITATLNSAAGQQVAGASVYSSSYVFVYAAGAPNGISGTVPFTWAAGDGVVISGAFFTLSA